MQLDLETSALYHKISTSAIFLKLYVPYFFFLQKDKRHSNIMCSDFFIYVVCVYEGDKRENKISTQYHCKGMTTARKQYYSSWKWPFGSLGPHVPARVPCRFLYIPLNAFIPLKNESDMLPTHSPEESVHLPSMV